MQEAGMGKAGRALVTISDDEGRETLVQVLAACDLEPIVCSSIGEVRTIVASEAADIVFCEYATLADGSFDDFPRSLHSGELRPPVIVCSRLYDPTAYLEVMDRGAFDYIVYPYRTDGVRWVLGTALCRSHGPALESKVNSRRATCA
jgi:DNA-binding NtrC family response regulator